jgi:hypothetical protein
MPRSATSSRVSSHADRRTRYLPFMRRIALAACLVLGAFAAAAGASPSFLPGPVTLDGIGGVTPGMTAEEVATAWHIPLRLTSTACTIVHVNPGAAHGSAIFVGGKLNAVFFVHGVRTSSGIGIGSTVIGLQKMYGRRLQSANGSHFYFLLRHDQPRWQIRFDTNGNDRVTQIGFGDSLSVHVVAGCA